MLNHEALQIGCEMAGGLMEILINNKHTPDEMKDIMTSFNKTMAVLILKEGGKPFDEKKLIEFVHSYTTEKVWGRINICMEDESGIAEMDCSGIPTKVLEAMIESDKYKPTTIDACKRELKKRKEANAEGKN